ncbi:MAG TPA: CRTAC1 family protein, partial [Acidobacteriota bacterium]|nr:CRTAC1 family protein [Acidobacteriota bacterium]
LRFKVANTEAGLPDDIYGLGLAIADLNDDGRADVFITHSNRLFLSQGSRFREVSTLNNVFAWQPLDGEDWPSGAAFGDLNRDGKLDLVIGVHHDPARNRIFMNQGIRDGIPRFIDITSKAGLPPRFPQKCPHVEIQDFDNDGWPDIYFSAAWKNGKEIVPVIYRNRGVQPDGLPRFDLARNGQGKIVYFPAGPTADFDRDGRLDLFLGNWFRGESCRLLKNRTSTGNWIQVKAPIGSRVKLISQNRLIGYQQVQTGFGYSSGQLPVNHFGVGDLRSVEIEVRLPDGRTERKHAVAVNRRIEFGQRS